MSILIERGYTAYNEAISKYPKVKMIVCPEGKMIRRNTAAENGAKIIWLASANAVDKPAMPAWIGDYLTSDMLEYMRGEAK